jgi:membrane-anchored glycerophosphoryl diester phosphodiesterase (GDPDase)
MDPFTQTQFSLTDWYNSKKRFTTILINIFLIFLVTSFIPSLVVQFPTLLKNLMTSEQIS